MPVSIRAQAEEPQQEPTLVAVPAPNRDPASVTLGEFARRVAVGKGFATGDSLTDEGAALALLRNGIEIRDELGSPVTEADAVGVLNALGYRLRTDTPSRTLDASRLDMLLEVFLVP